LQRITLNASLFSWKFGDSSSFYKYLQEVAEQSVFLFFKNLDAVSAFGGKFCSVFILSPWRQRQVLGLTLRS
jgi:hypothetical protein